MPVYVERVLAAGADRRSLEAGRADGDVEAARVHRRRRRRDCAMIETRQDEGEADPAQPAVERGQVHESGDGPRVGAVRRRRRAARGARTRASASSPRRSTRSGRTSASWTSRARDRTAARASGLSITRRLTQQLGGQVTVESSFGVGNDVLGSAADGDPGVCTSPPLDPERSEVICESAVAFGGVRLRRPPAAALSQLHVRGRRRAGEPRARRHARRRAVSQPARDRRHRRRRPTRRTASRPSPSSRCPTAEPVLERRICSRSAAGSPSTTSCRSASRSERVLPAALGVARRRPEPSRRTRRVASLARRAAVARRSATRPSRARRKQRALFELHRVARRARAGRASHRAARSSRRRCCGRWRSAGWSRSTTRSSRAIRSPGARRRRQRRTRRRPRSARAIDALVARRGRRRLPAARRHRQRQDARLHRAAAPRRARARARRRSCSCRRSRSRRRPSIAFAPCSATRSPCCTARSATASATTNGSRCATGASGSPSARARRSSRRSPTSARSSSTRSTRRATSRARRRATTRARSRSCARAHEGAVVVLGSATPSLESWVNATARQVHAARRCPSASAAATLPMVEVIDRREAARANARRRQPQRDAADWLRMVVSDELETALADRLAKQEQSILLLNRRGYAAFVQCGAVRRRRDLSELLDQPHVSSRAGAAGLPLLPARRGAADAVPALPRRDDAAARARHAAGGAAARRPLSVGAHRAHGRRHDERQVGARRDSRPRRRAARSTSCSARR